MVKFTDAQIEKLREEYAKLETVDPTQPSYTRLIFLLDGMKQSALKQLAEANIKFVSGLARNRLK